MQMEPFTVLREKTNKRDGTEIPEQDAGKESVEKAARRSEGGLSEVEQTPIPGCLIFPLLGREHT